MEEFTNLIKNNKNGKKEQNKERKNILDELKDKKSYINKIMIFLIIFLNISIYFLFFLYYKNSQSQDNNILENFFPRYDDKSEEITILDKFYKFSQNGTLLSSILQKKRKNPQISIIIPIYNNQKHINRIITSIENQVYKDIEIIFVDDASTDNSINEINKYTKKDKRIRIIKHIKKEGLFITRNDGVLNAKGEYLLFIEPNGLLTEGILRKIYGSIQMYDADIIKFESFSLYNNTFEKNQFENDIKRNKVITQPDIIKMSFYPFKGELFQNNLYLWGKAIKRELYTKILNNLSEDHKNKKWNYYEDSALDFLLLKNAESYVIINENGYINELEDNYENKNNEQNKANEIIKDLFLLADFFFDYTEDNLYEKSIAIYQIRRIIDDYKKDLESINQGYDYYYKILDKYSNCKNILPRHQFYINQIKQILKKRENPN